MRGKFLQCRAGARHRHRVDGGYAEYLVAPAVAVARLPDGMPFAEAAPLLCAGVTTFNALRNVGARPGDLVAVQGLGGLGHLGVQYARAMGFEVVAIARGAEKGGFAKQLGAAHYVDSEAEDAGRALTDRGGARRDPGDGAQRQGHLGAGAGPGRRGLSADRGRAVRAHHGRPDRPDRARRAHPGLVVGHGARLDRRDGVRAAHWA